MIIYDILIKLPKNVINAFDHDAPPSTATSRAQLCIRYCSNKHTHVAGIADEASKLVAPQSGQCCTN
jgi:hypothetical protein